MHIGKMFLLLGVIFLVIGIIWTFIGKLPGDISFKTGKDLITAIESFT